MGLSSVVQGALKLISAGPGENEQALIEAMAERVAEIVDERECQITTDGRRINFAGANRLKGNTMHAVPYFALRASLSPEKRLEVAFEGLAKSVQQFLTSSGKPWPAADAEPHVHITPETINVWWGGPDETRAPVRLRPFSRHELGV